MVLVFDPQVRAMIDDIFLTIYLHPGIAGIAIHFLIVAIIQWNILDEGSKITEDIM